MLALTLTLCLSFRVNLEVNERHVGGMLAACRDIMSYSSHFTKPCRQMSRHQKICLRCLSACLVSCLLEPQKDISFEDIANQVLHRGCWLRECPGEFYGYSRTQLFIVEQQLSIVMPRAFSNQIIRAPIDKWHQPLKGGPTPKLGLGSLPRDGAQYISSYWSHCNFYQERRWDHCELDSAIPSNNSAVSLV